MTTAVSAPPAESDEQQVYVPAVGQSVRVRAIPPKLLRAIQRKATRRGRFDGRELLVWKLFYGIEDPNFTEAQVRTICGRYTMRALEPIVDRIDEISGTDEHLQVEVRGPRSFCEGTRAAVMATSWLRRPTSTPSRSQGHERRRGCNERSQGSRRTSSRSAGGGSSGDSSDGESEPAKGRRNDLSPEAAELAAELRAHSKERVARWRAALARPEQLPLEGWLA